MRINKCYGFKHDVINRKLPVIYSNTCVLQHLHIAWVDLGDCMWNLHLHSSSQRFVPRNIITGKDLLDFDMWQIITAGHLCMEFFNLKKPINIFTKETNSFIFGKFVPKSLIFLKNLNALRYPTHYTTHCFN